MLAEDAGGGHYRFAAPMVTRSAAQRDAQSRRMPTTGRKCQSRAGDKSFRHGALLRRGEDLMFR